MKKIISIFLAVITILSLTQAAFCADGENDVTFESVKSELFDDKIEIISNKDLSIMVRYLGIMTTSDNLNENGIAIFEPAVMTIIFTFDSSVDVLTVDAKALLDEIGINSKYFDISRYTNVTEDEKGNKVCGFQLSWSKAFFDDFEPSKNLDCVEMLCLFATAVTATGSYGFDYCGICKNESYINNTFKYDVNYDGRFNAKDMKFARECIAGSSDLFNFTALDQNNDGFIRAFDLALLKQAFLES